jgi:hypothetical protein
MSLQLKKSLAQYRFEGARSFLKSAIDEGQEEALDELINGFVTDAVLEENTPMMERMNQSLYAGLLGGVMGAGVPAVQKINQRMRPDKFGQAAMTARLEREFDEGVAERLEGSGSPLTAEAFRKMRKRPARERVGVAPPAGEPPAGEPPAGEPPAGEPPAGAPPVAPEAPTTGPLAGLSVPQIVDIAQRVEDREKGGLEKQALTTEERAALEFKDQLVAETTAPAGAPPAGAAGAIPVPYDTIEVIGDLGSGQGTRRISGQAAPIVNYKDRAIVFREVNGVVVPFYLSTGEGGKKTVASGKWYPFFGVGGDGWINKGSSTQINDYYGSPDLRRVAETLDSELGSVSLEGLPKITVGGAFEQAVAENLGIEGAETAEERKEGGGLADRNMAAVVARINANAAPAPERTPLVAPAPEGAPAPEEQTLPDEQTLLFDEEVGAKAEQFLATLTENLNEESGQQKLRAAINEHESQQDMLTGDGDGTAPLSVNPEKTRDFSELTFPLTSEKHKIVAERLGVDLLRVVRSETGRLSLVNPVPESRWSGIAGYVGARARAIEESMDTSDSGHFDLTAFKAAASLAKEDASPFKEGETLGEAEMAEVMDYIHLAVRFGYPIRVNKNALFGLPRSRKYIDKSNFLAQVVYNTYPVIEIPEAEGQGVFTSSRKTTFFDPVTGKLKKGKLIKGVTIRQGEVGVFNNDPVVVAEMLAHGLPVVVPEGLEIGNLNPAFDPQEVKDGMIRTVYRPTLDGRLKESVNDPIEKIGTVAANHDLSMAHAGVPFIAALNKILPAGAQGVSPEGKPVAVGGEGDMGGLEVQIRAFERRFEAHPDWYDTFVSWLGGGILNEDFRRDAVIGAGYEYRLIANLFELRGDLLHERADLVKTVGGRKVLKPEAKKRAVAILMRRMRTDSKKDVADRVGKLIRLKKSKGTYTETIIQFIEDKVLNNSDFAGDKMPTYQMILARNFDRYADQHDARGLTERQNAIVNLAEEGAMDALTLDTTENNALYIGGPDPSDPVSPQAFSYFVKENIKEAIQLIEDPSNFELKEALIDLVRHSVIPNADPATLEGIKNESAKKLMDRVGGWMTDANDPAVKEFTSLLESGRFRSGLDLRLALELRAIGNRLKGDPSKNAEYVENVRQTMSKGDAGEFTTKQAQNLLRGLDQAMRKRFSRSHLTAAERKQAEIDNAADIARLGLVSGDPESVVNALQKIADTSSNPNHRIVAEMLLEDPDFIRSVGFSMTNAPKLDIAGEYSKGTDGVNRVLINTANGNGRGLENVLLEEFMHATLFDIVNKSENQLTKKQRLALQRLKGLRELAAQSYKENYLDKGKSDSLLEDGLANLDEFVGAILLSPEFQTHLKALDPPQGQRGFFRRVLDAIVNMFRKVSSQEGDQYVDALKDVLDLGPKRQFNGNSHIAAAVAYDAGKTAELEAARRAERSELTVALEEEQQMLQLDDLAPVSKEELNEEQQRKREQVIAHKLEEDKTKSPEERTRDKDVAVLREENKEQEPDPERQAALVEALQFLKEKGGIPFGVKVLSHEKAPDLDRVPADSIMWMRRGVMYVNLEALTNELEGKSPNARKARVQAMVNEEVAHIASYGSLTIQDIDQVAGSLTDTEFDAIIEEYYKNDPDDKRIVAAKANLRSPDPKKSRTQKRILVEEKLRMRLQRATRGFTTEEDNEFWNSDPGLLSLLSRYIKGVLNSYIARRQLAKGGAQMDAALNALIIEMTAIQMGFGRHSGPVQDLDPDTPAEVVETYRRLVGYNPIQDMVDQAEDDEIGMILASSLIDKKTMNTLSRYAGVEMYDADKFVDIVPDFHPELETLDAQLTDPNHTIDRKALVETIGRLESDTTSVTLVPRTDDNNKYSIYLRTKTNGEVAEYGVRISLTLGRAHVGQGETVAAGSVIDVGGMFPEVDINTGEPASASRGQSTALLMALIGNNTAIGASLITTTAGGEGTSLRNKEIYGAMLKAGLGDLIAEKAKKSAEVVTGLSTVEEAAANLDATIREQLGIISSIGEGRMTGYSTWARTGLTNTAKDQAEFETKIEETQESPEKLDEILNRDSTDQVIIEAIQFAAAAPIIDLEIDASEIAPFLPAAKKVRDTFAAEFQEMVDLLYEAGERTIAKGKGTTRAKVVGRTADLFEAWHGAIEGETAQEFKKRQRRISILWKRYGEEMNMEFSLLPDSDNFKAVAQNTLLAHVLRDPEVRKLITAYNEEVAGLGDPDEDPEYVNHKGVYQDTHNDMFHELGYDFDLFTSTGGGGVTISRPLSKTDFEPLIELLEMPMAEYGAYKAPKNWFMRLIKGEVGHPIKALLEQREEFRKASDKVVSAYQKTLKSLAREAFGTDNLSEDQLQLLARAQGYVDGNLAGDAIIARLDREHRGRLDAINTDPYTALSDRLRTEGKTDEEIQRAIEEEKKVQRGVSRETRDTEVTAAEDVAIAKIEKDRDDALAEISNSSPALAAHIMDMREQLIRPIAQNLKKKGISAELGIKIDRTGGIYLTRAYRMFTDPTYAERVKTDDTYAEVRENAARMLPQEYVKHRVDELLNGGKSATEALKIAKEDLSRKERQAKDAGTTFGDQMVQHFLSRYDGSPIGSPSIEGMKVLEENLKQRLDLPQELRALLGELGPEVGTDLIVRTTATVTTLAAQQTFLHHLKEVGLKGGWLVTAADKAADDKYKGYVRVRPDGKHSANDPLAELYIEPEIYKALELELNGSLLNTHTTAAQEAVGTMANVAQKLTGMAMVAKTLGSVGFYLRNMLGNILFFGPAQGFYRMDKMLITSLKHTGQRLKNPDQIDAYLTELIALGIVGDEVRAGIMRELLDGKAQPESILEKLDEFTDDIVAVGHGKKTMKWLQNKAIDLSAGVDGGYKIALFEHELKVLERAARKHPDSPVRAGGKPLGKMSSSEIKREAARKVKMTAQSLSQAPPIVRDLSRSQFGILFAPFLRFKAEVPRIVINTYKLGFEELRSGNPVLQKRGAFRLGSMTGMLGVFSVALPAILAKMSSIGDDEDEALRKSMPSYLRGHTFWFRRDKDGNLYSLDLTYLNPFSLLADPVMRSLEQIRRGEFGDAGAAFAGGLIFDTYLDDQILAGTVSDVLANKDATTDRPIWTPEVDGAGAAMLKSLGYIFKGAYEPRILKDALQAREAIGGDYSEFSDSPLGELLDGTYPVKVHKVDLEQQYRRFLRDHTTRMKLVTDKKYQMFSKRPIGDDEIRDLYDDELKGRRALNAELLRVARGFEGLGVAPQDQYKLMTTNGVGKNKAKLLFYGAMDRPVVNKKFAEGLYKRNLQHRLQPLLDQMGQYNRYLLIEDPE